MLYSEKEREISARTLMRNGSRRMRHRAGTMEAPSAEMFVSLDDLHNIEDIEVIIEDIKVISS